MVYTSSQYNAANTVISSPLQKLHNKAVALQAQTKLDNAAQSSAFWALRSGGKAEAAAQMKNPISTQKIISKKYGTYIVEGRTTENLARAAAEKRTADLKKQAAQKAQAELDRQARMITVSNNSKNLPNYTAQNQDFSDTTKYNLHGNNNSVSNNNVIANEVWVDPNVTVTGQSRTSKPSSSSIAANENYNTATAMNDFMSANPSSDINMGTEIHTDPIWWKSAAPQDNSVKTSDLGGDIQHQETDSNTNVGYLPFQNQVPSDTNWADSFGQNISLGTVGIGLAAIGILLQLGKKK